YNGAPKGLKHCSDVGCTRAKQNVPSGTRHELCRGVHAEQNALIQAAVFGTSVEDAIIYSTHFPCTLCAKLIVNAGICEVVYSDDYIDDLAKNILSESNVVVRQFKLPMV
ncbi:MAG TPA: cytidine deaminase, partial [Euryarchaeota archaeon]|nr:cytidine deaminase [Euryarchaeota archaeon]